MSIPDIYYGVIDEDSLSLHGPRAIDGDEVHSLAAAFKAAATMIEDDGVEQVAIVRCKYYGEDGNGGYSRSESSGANSGPDRV